MKCINLWYKQYCLGSLQNTPDGYLWIPNLQSIKLCSSNYPEAMEYFELSSSARVYSTIPAYYNEFITAANRADLVERAKITSNDNLFEALYKLSKLKLFNDEFIIKSE